MVTLFLILVFAAIVSIPWPRRIQDPLDDLQPRHSDVPVDSQGFHVEAMDEPNIFGEPGSLSDQAARQALDEIVNNDQLNLVQKECWLDALYFKVSNCHEMGMAAPVIEDIQNEGTALRYPEWHGRHGDWTSVRR